MKPSKLATEKEMRQYISKLESKLDKALENGRLEVLEQLEMFIKLNEDDFDRGKGIPLLQRFIDQQLNK